MATTYDSFCEDIKDLLDLGSPAKARATAKAVARLATMAADAFTDTPTPAATNQAKTPAEQAPTPVTETPAAEVETPAAVSAIAAILDREKAAAKRANDGQALALHSLETTMYRLPFSRGSLNMVVSSIEQLSDYRFARSSDTSLSAKQNTLFDNVDIAFISALRSQALTLLNQDLAQNPHLTMNLLTRTALDFKAGKPKSAVKPTTADSHQPAVYSVERLLAGAQIGDYYYPESIVHRLGLNLDDQVTLKTDRNPQQGLPFITLVKSVGPEPESKRIYRFDRALIEFDPEIDQLVIKQDVDHHLLTLNKQPLVYRIPDTERDYLHLTAGQLVTLSWYINTNTLPDFNAARITWVHNLPSMAAPDLSVKVGRPLNKTRHNSKRVYTPRIDFDLTGLRVLFVGYGKELPALTSLVAAHTADGQEPNITNYDSSLGNRASVVRLEQMVRSADLVIPIIASISHRDANTAIELAKKYDVKYAVAEKTAPLSIEQAIYRGLNQLPAYNTSSFIVDYPWTQTTA